MKIIQLSDLHIGEKLGNSEQIVQELFNNACSMIKEGDEVAICICGDIVDKGSVGNIEAKYKNAERIMEVIKEKMRSLKCKYRIMMVPGNHDILSKWWHSRKQHFEHFYKFASKVTDDKIYNQFMRKNVLNIEFGGINWVLCNSAHHGNKDYGLVDIDSIKGIIGKSKMPTVLLMHHTLFSDSNEDASALRNGYQVMDVIKNDTIAILHGHTHGFKNIKIGNRCLVVGVGPFLKNVPEINKQLNLLEINSQSIRYIKNFFWRSDIQVSNTELYHRADNETYSGNELQSLITQVKLDVEDRACLHNVLIHYQASFTDMENQIMASFPNDLECAREWLSCVCPNTLYYNHGQTIASNESMEYVKKILLENPTSRRAIITLLNQKDIQNSKDGMLPSFGLVQFSFPTADRGELVISLYMRALEVSEFLAVNLCELFLMAKSLKEDNLSVSSVNISLFAHRVAAIKNFDAFRKAELDRINEDELTALLKTGDFKKIVDMLSEKRKSKETILHTEGIQLLKHCVHNCGLDKHNSLYKKIENLENAVEYTKKQRELHSDLYDYEKAYEKSETYASLEKAYTTLISAFAH